MQDHSRTQSNDKRNKSMLSTQNMSCNQSHATNFFYDNKLNAKPVFLQYADTPYKKIPPRWNQSAATWRHTSHRYSFSKDSRFKDYKVEYTDIIEPQIPTTRSTKSCTFGKGKKKPISQIVLRNAKQKPSPDRYNMEVFDQSTRNRSKGKSFGIGWKSYQRNFIDHRKDVYAPFQNQQNPPAKYQVRQSPGKDKRKFSMYGRLKMYTQKMAQSKNWVPGARYLIKDRHLYNEVGLHQRNFAFGERLDLSMPANDYPGSKYQIPGFCARFTKIQKKLQKSLPQQLIN